MSKSQDTTLSTSISKTNISKHAGVQASETVLILQGGGSLGLGFDSSGNLWVADFGNSRVLMYPKGTGFTNGEAATIVLGQSSFTTDTSDTTATTLRGPFGLAFDSSGNLWVSDQGNSRVLKYTAITSWLEILNSLLR